MRSFVRQFFVTSDIRLSYHRARYSFECMEQSEEFIHAILAIYIDKTDKYDIVSEGLNLDMPLTVKNDLLDTFKLVESMDIIPIQDEYFVRVHLKDHSLFRFAPCRMSIVEKKELDNIIDNLLKQKIIKPSISPYCSCVILIPKKNGQKRMYVATERTSTLKNIRFQLLKIT